MTELARAVEPPRSRGRLKWTLGFAAIAATGFGVQQSLSRQEPVVASPPAPPLISPIMVPLPAPQLVVIRPPPPPILEPSAPEVPEVPEPRATAPVIRAECVARSVDAEQPPHCMWDTGFPAISADGTTIATELIPIDDGRGNPGLTIQFLDIATNKRVKSVLVLDPDEYVTYDDAKRPALDKRIARRAARLQDALVGYRSMLRLGASTDDSSTVREAGGVRADTLDDAVRIVDTATNLAIWQRRFDVAVEFPNRKLDGERCEPITASEISAAWDPQTRTALASVDYLTGPEFCGHDVQRDYAMRVKP